MSIPYSCPYIDDVIGQVQDLDNGADIVKLLETIRQINSDLREENGRLSNELEDALGKLADAQSELSDIQREVDSLSDDLYSRQLALEKVANRLKRLL